VPTGPWDPEEQLFQAVLGEFGLWELTDGTECNMHGAPVFHPAPEPSLASERLLGWLDAGLIELVEDRTPPNWNQVREKERRRLAPTWFPAAPTERARAVLAAPSRWKLTEPDGLLSLRPTDHGLTVGSEAWGTSLADGGPRPPWWRPSRRSCLGCGVAGPVVANSAATSDMPSLVVCPLSGPLKANLA
jgi:hypothetical protein